MRGPDDQISISEQVCQSVHVSAPVYPCACTACRTLWRKNCRLLHVCPAPQLPLILHRHCRGHCK